MKKVFWCWTEIGVVVVMNNRSVWHYSCLFWAKSCKEFYTCSYRLAVVSNISLFMYLSISFTKSLYLNSVFSVNLFYPFQFVYLSACLPACLSACLSACLPACLSLCLCVCVCVFISLNLLSLSVCLFISPILLGVSGCMSSCLSVFLYVCLFLSMFIALSPPSGCFCLSF